MERTEDDCELTVLDNVLLVVLYCGIIATIVVVWYSVLVLGMTL